MQHSETATSGLLIFAVRTCIDRRSLVTHQRRRVWSRHSWTVPISPKRISLPTSPGRAFDMPGRPSARVNQSIFKEADLSGTSLFRASAVKTEFTDARLAGQRGAILADRCPGLLQSLRAAGDPNSERVAELIEELTELLAKDVGKST
jgi:hypothetical protein